MCIYCSILEYYNNILQNANQYHQGYKINTISAYCRKNDRKPRAAVLSVEYLLNIRSAVSVFESADKEHTACNDCEYEHYEYYHGEGAKYS